MKKEEEYYRRIGPLTTHLPHVFAAGDCTGTFVIALDKIRNENLGKVSYKLY
jgi:hypothetical protein